MKCVLHDDRMASASVNIDEGKFKCFACDFHGDALDLVQRKEGTKDFASTVTALEGILGRSIEDLLPTAKGKSRRRVFEDAGPVRGQRQIGSPRLRRKPFAGT